MSAEGALGVVGVVHLVRHANGLTPFITFIDSLRRGLPGGDWKLVLIFKGFPDHGEAGAFLALVADLPVETVFISDDGTDILAYFKAARATRCDTLVFFNSFSVLLAPDWFETYAKHLAAPGVGLVGATGSLEAVARNHRVYASLDRRFVQRSVFRALAAGLSILYPPFPNPHVRTNGFMIRRRHFLATRLPVGTRLRALWYESGRRSLTRQIQAMGLEVVVVNRAGEGFAPDRWVDSATFRSDQPSKLLVGDNRTREYEEATAERKRLLKRLAWGTSEVP